MGRASRGQGGVVQGPRGRGIKAAVQCAAGVRCMGRVAERLYKQEVPRWRADCTAGHIAMENPVGLDAQSEQEQGLAHLGGGSTVGQQAGGMGQQLREAGRKGAREDEGRQAV